MVLIFSKDRAFQLEACLRSFYECAQDGEEVHVHVIWTASTERHGESYQLLMKDYGGFTNLFFVREKSFRVDVLATLGKVSRESLVYRMLQFLEGLSSKLSRSLTGPLIGSLLRVPPVALFVVDDTLFLQPFRIEPLTRQLLNHPQALAFSLRLGERTDYFYMGNRAQAVPKMAPLSGADELAIYPWPEADGDYAYPLEISSSLLKLDVVTSRLLRKEWKSPNTLELILAHMSGRYKKDYPELLTFRVPRAVSVPLNMVQTDFLYIRCDHRVGRSSEELCELFFQGVRADLSGLSRLAPNSVHVEFEYLPEHRQKTPDVLGPPILP